MRLGISYKELEIVEYIENGKSNSVADVKNEISRYTAMAKHNIHFKTNIINLPTGSFYCIYNDSKYIVTKHLCSDGKIIKIYAKELKGTDIVSGNYFLTIKNGLLKPCEMSDKKVIDFVNNLQFI